MEINAKKMELMLEANRRHLLEASKYKAELLRQERKREKKLLYRVKSKAMKFWKSHPDQFLFLVVFTLLVVGLVVASLYILETKVFK